MEREITTLLVQSGGPDGLENYDCQLRIQICCPKRILPTDCVNHDYLRKWAFNSKKNIDKSNFEILHR